MKNEQYAGAPGYSSHGNQVVALSSVPGEYGRLVTPKISGVPTPFILVDSTLTAGNRHIDDGTPTLDEVLQEQTIFTFDSTDDVRKIIFLPVVEARYIAAVSGTAGLVSVTHEVARFVTTINPGDDTTQCATRLLNEYPDSLVFEPNAGYFQLPTSVSVTRVGVMARASGVANALKGGARLYCWGVSYA